MSKKNVVALLIFLALFFQLAVNKSFAQTSNQPIYKERFVVKALRTIFSAQYTYHATNNNFGSLNDLYQADLIDFVLASGDKYGYLFAVTVTPRTPTTPARFAVTATPRQYRKTGRRSFYVDESYQLRGADKNGGLAINTDPIMDWCAAYESERCTISTLRTLHGAQATYQASIGNGNYGTLNQLYEAGLISQNIASGSSNGYYLTCQVTIQTSNTPATFKVLAVPRIYGVTGFRSFYIDESGVMRGADKNGQPADENDPPITD